MSWKTIVVGVDDTEASKRALICAAEIARPAKAKLVLTSVVPVLVGMAGARGIGPFDPADPPDAHKLELVRAKDLLAEHDVDVKVDVEFDLEAGEPAHAIVDCAERHDADLIVVGTREPHFFERLLGGSVSGSVARKAHCDVLIVH